MFEIGKCFIWSDVVIIFHFIYQLIQSDCGSNSKQKPVRRSTKQIQPTSGKNNAFSCMKNSILFLIFTFQYCRTPQCNQYKYLVIASWLQCTAQTVYLFSWPYLDRIVLLILALFAFDRCDSTNSDTSYVITAGSISYFHRNMGDSGDGAIARKAWSLWLMVLLGYYVPIVASVLYCVLEKFHLFIVMQMICGAMWIDKKNMSA